MNKTHLCCALLLITGALSSFGELIFKNDFQKKSPIKFWTSGGKYKINFMGLTTENAPEGRKVFKLDVTFLKNSYGYYYFQIPLKFMPSSNLRLKTRVLLGKENTARFGIGFNAFFPEFRRSGCKTLCKFSTSTDGKWRDLDLDGMGWLNNLKVKFCKKYAPPVTRVENLSPYIDRVILFSTGSAKQKRLVVYLDGIEVSGDAVPRKDWSKLLRKYQEQVLLKQQKLLSECRGLLDRHIKASGKSVFSNNCEKFLKPLEERKKRDGKSFILNKDEYKRILREIADLKSAGGKKLSDKALVYTLNNPIISTMILPKGSVPLQAELGGKAIKLVAAKGEFESFSILVKAMRKLDKLIVVCDDLKSRSGALIPAGNVDLKSVKCWYQAKGAWYTWIKGGGSQMTPELLLNDDSLVKVDDNLKTNFIKLRFPSGDKYWNVDDPKWNKKKRTSLLPVDQFPVRDAKKLLPLLLNKNNLKQFWGTVKVPQTASPGVYTGILKVLNGNDVLAKVKLKLRVLTFELPKPKTRYSLKKEFISSIFYRSRYNPKYPNGTISSEDRSTQQIAAELKNMREHNIFNPNCYQKFNDKKSFAKMLELRNAAGMKGLAIYYLGIITSPSWNKRPQNFLKLVKDVKAFMEKFGVSEYYCFGVDEAHGERLVAQLNVWKMVHESGVKMLVSGSMRNLHVADKIDIQVNHGKPTLERAALWKKKNKNLKLLAYAWPQGGVEDPVFNRRGLGMTTWLANYDGTMTYAYMHAMGNGWNDSDHRSYRDHNYVYPTTDGVISTIALVGFREGVDDVRYATKLKELIEQHRNGPKKTLAAAAQTFLDELRDDGDLHLLRLEIINYILELLK